MNRECLDKNIGSRLHAYELDMLTKEETEQFELHMMKCEFCLSQINKFSDGTILIRSDEEVKKGISRLDNNLTQQPGLINKLSRFFGFYKPFSYKPVVSVLFVFTIIASYFVLNFMSNPDTEATQQIKLLSHRSTNNNINYLNPDKSIELVFGFDGSKVNHCYKITISNEEDSIIYETKSFCEFDETNLGKIIIPKDSLTKGRYQLMIIDPESNLLNNSQEYRFTILYK